MFLRCVRIEPHSSGLTNVENSTRKFHQSVQNCCREEQREENNGNCKAFCVIRKRNIRVLATDTDLSMKYKQAIRLHQEIQSLMTTPIEKCG